MDLSNPHQPVPAARQPAHAPAPPPHDTPAGSTPTSGAPTSGSPASGSPANGAPTSGVPASGIPASGAPVSGAPVSAPPGEPPVSDLRAAFGGRPATWGWRGRANRLAGLSLPAAHDELLHRAARRRLLQPFRRSMTVVVANPKGGAAKTPTALLAAATLGFYRGGYTLAWDNNETRGTLGLRAEAAAHTRTVTDLLADLEPFRSGAAGAGVLSGYLRPQSARFDVLASDESPGGMDMIDDEAFGRLWGVLSRYYRMLVVDTGNNLRAPNWQAATNLADCLIIPTTVAPDVAESGLWMLDHLERSGRADLCAGAVAVISCADPRPDQTLLDSIIAAYTPRVRDVVVIPHDPVLRTGSRVEYESLAPATRRAWLLACTSVIDSLAERDQD